MLPRPSTTISFQPWCDRPLRSAWVTRDPSGSCGGAVLVPGHDQQPAVGQPVDRERERRRDAGDDLAVALEIDGDDLLRAPVGEPQAAVVPARRLADREPGQQNLRSSWCSRRRHAASLRSCRTRRYSTRELLGPVLSRGGIRESAPPTDGLPDIADERPLGPQAQGDPRGGHDRVPAQRLPRHEHGRDRGLARRLQADRLQALRRQGATLLGDRQRHGRRGQRAGPRRGAEASKTAATSRRTCATSPAASSPR